MAQGPIVLSLSRAKALWSSLDRVIIWPSPIQFRTQSLTLQVICSYFGLSWHRLLINSRYLFLGFGARALSRVSSTLAVVGLSSDETSQFWLRCQKLFLSIVLAWNKLNSLSNVFEGFKWWLKCLVDVEPLSCKTMCLHRYWSLPKSQRVFFCKSSSIKK